MAPTTSTSASSADESHIRRSCNPYILYRKDFFQRLRSQGQTPSWKAASRASGEAWKAETAEVKALYQRLAAEEKVAHALRHPNYKYCPKKSGTRAAEKDARRAEAAARKAEKRAEAEKKKAATKAAKATRRAAEKQPRLAPTQAETAPPSPVAGPSHIPAAVALPPPIPGEFDFLPPPGPSMLGELATQWQQPGWTDQEVEDFWRGVGFEAPEMELDGLLAQLPAADQEGLEGSLLAELYDGSAPLPAPFPSTPDFPSPPTVWPSPIPQPDTPALAPTVVETPPATNDAAGYGLIWLAYDPATKRDVPFREL